MKRRDTLFRADVHAQVVMPDSSALWWDAYPMHERRYFSKTDGYQVWISFATCSP